ncbi:hypothetical protein Pmar_PMAR005187 [Perkinsus marinus ATCC 50983]|uniref:Uncharacterized protein n=1 Tax=Perkinsus marinus (strain ATCC 50983 / TXsc) TaxID=423536 RepID=C5KAV6_PERM5|nr:hypothetical protein Pmar_PMAR005187 [Perkinsus marinus ATCC 50983]EER18282.1 hypothetical protein Pmar_PMAR005187 [Perkinsus marinus ATCC 50983]|eukprot:XP_002786486.1 hypothetical protein Pmar_PMAR005187 [Perkinsus marinus ATCC 50983]
MGQQRGKTTSFEDWLKIQREVEAREAEERAATEAAAALEAAAAEPDLAPQRPRYYCAKRSTVFKESRSVEGSVDFTTRPSVVKLLRTRLWQPHQVDQWSIEKREESRESSESSSSESSTQSVRVAPRPRMPRRAAGLM